MEEGVPAAVQWKLPDYGRGLSYSDYTEFKIVALESLRPCRGRSRKAARAGAETGGLRLSLRELPTDRRHCAWFMRLAEGLLAAGDTIALDGLRTSLRCRPSRRPTLLPSASRIEMVRGRSTTMVLRSDDPWRHRHGKEGMRGSLIQVYPAAARFGRHGWRHKLRR